MPSLRRDGQDVRRRRVRGGVRPAPGETRPRHRSRTASRQELAPSAFGGQLAGSGHLISRARRRRTARATGKPPRHRLFVHWSPGLSVKAGHQLVPFWCHVATNARSGWGSRRGWGGRRGGRCSKNIVKLLTAGRSPAVSRPRARLASGRRHAVSGRVNPVRTTRASQIPLRTPAIGGCSSA